MTLPFYGLSGDSRFAEDSILKAISGYCLRKTILFFLPDDAILLCNYSLTGVRRYGLVKREAGENPERCRHCVPERCIIHWLMMLGRVQW